MDDGGGIHCRTSRKCARRKRRSPTEWVIDQEDYKGVELSPEELARHHTPEEIMKLLKKATQTTA